ncbi:hypothetical protein EYF80_022207 [Liparis tanakae]|uniref:Uncharacterized protein n=1 Tax=Liparis tanakae TaxID=230148 RepID=A0A4Z2HRA8_9TELE|nr:hypothetical protein EYF80_022207 [Liparis tanakae]
MSAEMLDELQTTLPRSHLVYHGQADARGCRNYEPRNNPQQPPLKPIQWRKVCTALQKKTLCMTPFGEDV